MFLCFLSLRQCAQCPTELSFQSCHQLSLRVLESKLQRCFSRWLIFFSRTDLVVVFLILWLVLLIGNLCNVGPASLSESRWALVLLQRAGKVRMAGFWKLKAFGWEKEVMESCKGKLKGFMWGTKGWGPSVENRGDILSPVLQDNISCGLCTAIKRPRKLSGQHSSCSKISTWGATETYFSHCCSEALKWLNNRALSTSDLEISYLALCCVKWQNFCDGIYDSLSSLVRNHASSERTNQLIRVCVSVLYVLSLRKDNPL